jgi:hypothetical protein
VRSDHFSVITICYIGGMRTKPSYISRFADPLPGGRAIMRVDIVIDGVLEQSYTEGSPASLETVQRHEQTIPLGS